MRSADSKAVPRPSSRVRGRLGALLVLARNSAAPIALTSSCLAACEQGEAPDSANRPSFEPHRELANREPLQGLPKIPPADPRVVALGRRLFFETELSSSGKISCASCHDLEHGGDDGRPKSKGADGQLGAVNAPTVLNASLNFVLFWDGRAKTLEEQIDGPVTHGEMNMTWPDVVTNLRAKPEYAALFASAFDDAVTANHVRDAIAAFERTLLTPGSRFDRWLAGEADALSPLQKEGYETFKSVGCVACHQGRNVGGNMFQRFGVLGDYFADRGNVTKADLGRFNVTGSDADRFVFRVPSLRNVELTAPYFHDGSADTLPRAVEVMAKYQLGRTLSEAQSASIVAFLRSMTAPPPDGARTAER